MSFEGYYQYLCKNGHYWGSDYYDDDNICSICQTEAIWSNLVDTTNGSFDKHGKRIDGYIKLEIKEQKKCEHCNSILETIYKIPKRGKYGI